MGCGSTKGQASSPNKKKETPPGNITSKEKKEDSPKKELKDVKTCAKDMESIGQTADMTILDFDKLSMTDLVSNGLFLVKAVIGLIQANIARNQLMKAVLHRMQSLEPSFDELQKKTSKLTRDPVVNLIHVVNRIKEFCEKMMCQDKSMWDRFKDAFSAKSQLEELAKLNELLTKGQNDLQIPLQLDTSKKIDKMFEYLKDMSERGGEVYSKNEKNGGVLPLAQRCLKNEEAFVFWFESMPTKFQMNTTGFEPLFVNYIEIYKNVKLKPDVIKKIMNLIRGSEEPLDDKELINAKQVNQFFESLPLEIVWDDLKSFEKTVEENHAIREKQIQQKIEFQAKELDKKLKENESKATEKEVKLAKNKEFFNFIAKKAEIRKKSSKIEVSIRNIFIKYSDGKMHIFGTSKKLGGDFSLDGSMEASGEMSLTLNSKEGESSSVEGSLDTDDSSALKFVLKTEAGKLTIIPDLDYWFGYYEQDDSPHNMNCFMKVIGKELVGLVKDEVGVSLWKGSLSQTAFSATQFYVGQHSAEYSGKVKRVGTTVKINGKWKIDELNDAFYLSYNEGGDENDEGDDEEVGNSDEFKNCPNGHALKWSSKSTGGYGDTFGCDNCGDYDRNISGGRWNCAQDSYDICGTCRKIPPEATKTCGNGHLLKWSNSAGGGYSGGIYWCDPCRREGKVAAGRWTCKECTFDLCHICRPK